MQRSPAGADTVWRTLASPRLSFGGRRRFAIGVGGVASKVLFSTFDIATRYKQPSPEQPGDTTERVIVQSGRSSSRVTPAFLLSARLATLDDAFFEGVHLAVGTAPRDAGSKLKLDYLLGVGVSAVDERILFAAGITSAEEQRIAEGYEVNDRLPTNQATVPVRAQRIVRPAFSLTFRVF